MDGLKNDHFNLYNRTTNRVESFFGSLKQSVSHRDTIQSFLQKFMSFLKQFRIAREEKFEQTTNKTHVSGLQCPVLGAYHRMITPYSFSLVEVQFGIMSKVDVRDGKAFSNNILRESTNTTCDCTFFKTQRLPCRHIFAVRKYNQLELFDEGLIIQRWRLDYFQHTVPAMEPVQITVRKVVKPRRKILNANEKFRKAAVLTNQLASVLTGCGMKSFEHYMDNIQQLIDFSKQNVLCTVNQPSVPEIRGTKRKTSDDDTVNKKQRNI